MLEGLLTQSEQKLTNKRIATELYTTGRKDHTYVFFQYLSNSYSPERLFL